MSLFFPDNDREQADVQSGDAYLRQLEQTQQALQAQGITPEMAVQYIRQQPNASPGLLQSALLSGVGLQQYASLADQDPGQDEGPSWFNEGVDLATSAVSTFASRLYEWGLKPVVRGAFAVTEGLSQELVQRPLGAAFAAMGASDQDVSFREAYNQYGTSAFFQALGNVIGDDEPDEVGRGFDLGQGFFTGGAAFEQQEEARQLTVRGQQANLGRLYLDEQLSWIGQDPGDRIYDVSTGIAQFAFDVLTDPTILLSAGTGGVAKVAGRAAGAGARVAGRSADEAADIAARLTKALTVEGTSQRARAARSFNEVVEGGERGVVSRLAEGVEGVTVADRVGASRNRLFEALGLVDETGEAVGRVKPEDIRTAIAENADNEEVQAALRETVGLIKGPNGRSAIFDKLQSFFANDGLLDALAAADGPTIERSFRAGRESSVPVEFIGALGRAETADEVAGILAEAISKGHITDRNFYGGFGNRVANQLRKSEFIQRKADTFSGIAARGTLDALDKDTSYGKLSTLARQAGLGNEDRVWLLDRMSLMERGNRAELFEIAGELYSRVGSRLLKDDPDRGAEYIRGLTDSYNQELEGLRLYFANEFGWEEGASALTERRVKKYTPDGTITEVVVPQPHLLSEFNKMSVPLPDIDGIRRAATKSDTMRKVYESAGWEWTNKSLRFITRGLFKPLVLLRPAYIVRTQLDDQMRMWAAGVDGIFASPRHLIQMAAKAPGELADLASSDPSVAMYARKILNQSILDVDGDSIAKPLRQRIWTSIQKPVPTNPDDIAVLKSEMSDYIEAWRTELGQLANDNIAAELIRNGFDIDATVAQILGRRVQDPAAREALEKRLAMFRTVDRSLNEWSPERMGRLQQLFEEERRAERVAERIEALRGGRPLDTLVDPETGQTLDLNEFDYAEPDIDEQLGLGPINEVDPEFDFGDEFDDFDPGFGPDDAITLEEFLEDRMEDIEAWAESIPLSSVWHRGAGFTKPEKVRTYIKHALIDDGVDEVEAAEFAKQFTDEWVKWTDSGENILDPEINRMHQNSFRESGTSLLNGAARASSKVSTSVYRGQAMPRAMFEDLVDKGVLAEGEIYRINRLSSASTQKNTASSFARGGANDLLRTSGGRVEPVQVFLRMDGETRGLNLGWSSSEAEMLLPEQAFRIRKVERFDPPPGGYVDEQGDTIYMQPDFEAVIIDLEAVTDGSVVQKVMEEGTQPFMRDLNRGAYDGTPQSLAGKAWDDLSPSERDEFEWINSQIQKWLNDDPTGQSVAFLQYHSELRHLVDNAPPVSDHVYLPGSGITFDAPPSQPGSRLTLADEFSEMVTDAEGNPVVRMRKQSEGIRPGERLRSDRNEPYTTLGRDSDIRERMTKGVIDPSMLPDDSVVIRLPRGSQALQVDKDGVYIVPPTQMTVTNVTERGWQTIIDVEVDFQPGRGRLESVPGNPRETSPLRDQIEHIARSSNEGAARLLTDEEHLRKYLESVVKRVQIKTGGNTEILEALKRESPIGEGAEDWEDIVQNDAAFERFLLDRWEDAPAFLKANRLAGDTAEDRGALDIITAAGFEYIVSKPAAYLSRFPAWIEFMSRDAADMMSSLRNDELREQFVDMFARSAKDGGLGATETQVKRLRAAADAAKGKSGVITDVQEARELALMHSSESVENLLFDVTNKSSFQDAFDVIFPFVDAWREGLSVWSRLLKEDPSLMAKGLAGARGAEESGMIYSNERGERMFAMPFSGTLSNFVDRVNEGQGLMQATAGAYADTVRGELDDSQINDVQSKFGFNLSGVNLMFNSIGPGFGPVVQWPAGAFLPDTPEYVGLQELVNPFGTSFDQAGDFANLGAWADALAPSWLSKIVNAWTGGEIDPVQWNGAVHDALRALEMSGDYDPTSLDDRARLTEDAERAARFMLVTRGVVHGTFVTSPSGDWAVRTDGKDDDFVPFEDWDPEADPDGVWHQINTLASSYYEIYERLGDHTLATQRFIEAYGVTPAYLRTPKSRVLTDLPATKEAAFWAEENREAMVKYPLVAGLFAPPDEGGEGFDYGVWMQQFRSGMRQTISPEDQIALANRTQAQQIYYNAKDRVDALDITSNQKRTILATVKAQLNEQFPGWEIGIAGLTNVPTDQKIEQLQMAANDPALENSALTPPLRTYFAAREQLLAAIRAETGSPVATFGRQDAERYRQALTQIGATLASQSPEFRGAWGLLRREVD